MDGWAWKRTLWWTSIVTATGVWLLFWGYGLAVSDVPPPSVIPGLVVLTLLACVVATLAMAIVLRLVALISAARAGRARQIERPFRWYGVAGAVLLAFTLLVAMTMDGRGGAFAGELAFVSGVLGAMACCIYFWFGLVPFLIQDLSDVSGG